MALKASLPSTKRLFAVFTVLAFVIALAFIMLNPQAATRQPGFGTRISGTVTGTLRLTPINGSNFYCLKTPQDMQYAISSDSSSIRNKLPGFVNKEVTISGSLITQNTADPCLKNSFLATDITEVSKVTQSCTTNGTKVDVVYVIDDSGTMDDNIVDRSDFPPRERPDNEQPVRLMRSLMPKLTGQLINGKDQAGLISFSSPITTRQALTTNLSAVSDSAIAMTLPAKAANVDEAVQAASDLLKASRRSENGKAYPGVVIVMADSRDLVVTGTASAIASKDAENSNIRYFTVDLGGDGSKLKNLAQVGGGVSYSLIHQNQIDGLVSQLTSQIATPFNNCVTVSLQSDKTKLRKNGNATLTYNITNNSRRPIYSAVLNQALPANLSSKTNQQVTVVVGDLNPGETKTSHVSINVKK